MRHLTLALSVGGDPAIAARLDGAWLAAPSPMPFEAADVCLTKMRGHPGCARPS